MDSPTVEVGYIARVGTLEPRIRLTIRRKTGSGIVEIRSSAIDEVCRPESEKSPDVLAAFRASVPALMVFLKRIIDDTRAGGVSLVTRARVHSHLAAARHGLQSLYYEIPDKRSE